MRPYDPDEAPGTSWAGLLGLAMICATVLAVVWMVTR